MAAYLDENFRLAIISAVLDQAASNGGFLSRGELSAVSVAGTEIRAIASQQGIWNPHWLDATLSVLSTPSGPYDDREAKDGLFRYSYRAGSIDGENRKLRRAYELDLPIVLLRKVRSDVFVPYGPVYVVGDNPEAREFLLALDESVRFLGNATDEQRRYAERVVRQRLHQREFRGRVISAYQTRCAVCLLRHGSLLDAAHIVGDSATEGDPVVSNGLALCKIHHAAFDRNLLGIAPDLKVHIEAELLAEIDGPMLRHGLQEMHGRTIVTPNRREETPDRSRLAQRFDQFLGRAG